jgi:hypothetical protein
MPADLSGGRSPPMGARKVMLRIDLTKILDKGMI